MIENKINWLNKLAIGSLKANYTRNIMIIISTAVICMVITTTLNAAISVVVTAEKQMTDQLGTTAQCSLNSPTDRQIEKLQSLSYIKDFGCEIEVGTTGYNDITMTMKYVDKEEWANHIKPTIIEFHGAMPKSADEIVISKSLMDVLGIQKPYIGKVITLSCRADASTKEKNIIQADQTLKIAGWYLDKRQYNIKTQGIVYVSDEFAAANGKTLQNSGTANFSFKRNAFVKEIGIIHKAFRTPQLEEPSDGKLLKLQNDLKLDADQKINKVRRVFGYVYNTQNLTPYILIIMPTLICGILLIFDCFYLTIFKDLRECGLLMSVGASLKQLNSILWRQALILGIAGNLAGLPLSILASRYVVPLYMKNIVGQNAEFVWTFTSFFIAAVITFLVVAISSQVVNVYLGRVSVLDSIRGGSDVKNKGLLGKAFEHILVLLPKRKKLVKSKNVFKLAIVNTMKNAKLNLHVLISLFVAAVVFLLAGAVASGIDPKGFAAEKLDGHDFILGNKTFYADYRDPIYKAGVCLQQDVFDISLVSEIKQQEGIKNVYTIGFLPVALRTNEALKIYNSGFEDGKYQLAGLWFMNTKYFQKSIAEEKYQIDMNKFDKGETVLINIMPDFFPANFNFDCYILNEEQVKNINLSAPANLGPNMEVVPNMAIGGENLFLLFSDGEDKPVHLPVGGYFTGDLYKNIGEFGQFPGIYTNYTLAKRLERTPITAQIMIDVDKAQVKNVERYLTDTLGDNSLIDFESEARLVRIMMATQNATYILGYLLATIVSIIGILEFLNMTMINTRIRRKEFAVLRSIGMAKKQLYRMLATEGIFNSLILIIFLATIGNWLIKKLYGVFGYDTYHMPIIMFALVSIGIVILLVLAPLISYSSESKKSISLALQEII